MQDFGGHPPFAHNPHVYDGVDPAGNPTAGLVAFSHAVVEDAPVLVGEQGPELVDPARLAALADEGGSSSSDEDEPVDVNGDGVLDGYEVFTKAELVAECEARGLAVSGNKPDLVARLQEADKPAGDGA